MADREKIDASRLFGEIVEYDGDAGWIQPSKAIKHDLADNNEGRVFFMMEDVEEELKDGPGSQVTFFAYSDGHIIGAMNVKLAPKRKAPAPKKGAKGSGKAEAASDAAGSSSGKGSRAVANHRLASAKVALGGASFGKGAKAGFAKDAAPAYGKGYGGGAPSPYAAPSPYGAPAGAFAGSSARAGYGAAPARADYGALGYGAPKGAYGAPMGAYGTGPPGGKGGYGAGPPAGKGGYGAGPPAGKGGYGAAPGGKGGYGAGPGADPYGAPGGDAPRKRRKGEKSLEDRVYNVIFDPLWNAVEAVIDKETDWDQREMYKRIMKYFTKATASEGLLNIHWAEAAKQIVDSVMGGYGASCGDKAWFFDLDLAPTLALVTWEVVYTGVCAYETTWEEVEEHTVRLYEDTMDGTMMEKAIWEIAMAIFDDNKVVTKLYKALNLAQKASIEAAFQLPKRATETERVEAFMQSWIEKSMDRAFMSVDSEEKVLTEDSVTQLFQGLVMPFGEAHPFSGVPHTLTQNEGRPAADWPFIEPTVVEVFAKWREENARPTKAGLKRQRREEALLNGDGAEDAAADTAEAAEEELA